MQAVAGLLGLVALVMSWYLLARRGRKAGWGAFKRHALGGIGGFFTMIIVTIIFAPATSDQATAASAAEPTAQAPAVTPEQLEREKAERLEAIKEMSHGIQDVLDTGDRRLAVTHFKKSIWDDKSWANSATFWPHDFLKALTDEYPDYYKEVSIRFVVLTSDKYGNEGQAEAMMLTYDMLEIAKVNWKGATPFDVLDLAQVSVRPIARAGVDEWCADGNARFARGFCTQALP